MSLEVCIDKIKASARGWAVELTVLQDGRPLSTEKLVFPAHLTRTEVQDRIGRLALARAEAEGRDRPDWDLQPGRRFSARDMLRPVEEESQDQIQAPTGD